MGLGYHEARVYGKYNETDADRFVRTSKLRSNDALTYDDLHDSNVRGPTKHRIVQELMRRSGESYEDCNKVVKQWSYSSNDEDYRSLSVQEAAAEEFGLELNEWQKMKLELYTVSDEEFNELSDKSHRLYKEMRLLERDAIMLQERMVLLNYDESNPSYVKVEAEYKEVLRKFHHVSIDSRETTMAYEKMRVSRTSGNYSHVLKNNPDPAGVTRKILRAMYNNTQDRFARMGITSVRLFRGYSSFGSAGRPPEGARIRLRNNVISSWTSEFETARTFGSGILAIDVPVSRIMGTCQTGLGCLEEQEFVLLGSTVNTDEAVLFHRRH
jgi:hypothetical protein